MKLVAVSQRVDPYPDRNERRDALDQELNRFLLDVGLIPVPVPNLLKTDVGSSAKSENGVAAWLEQIGPGAVVLSGGNSIGECLERDETEGHLLDHAEKTGIPVLGICRGMQMMAVRAGAELVPIEGHVRTRHVLDRSGCGAGLSAEVNSYHDWSVRDCPQDYEVIATSEDGAIEAMRHLHLPWEGWMWHPEREKPFSRSDLQRAGQVLLSEETV